MHKITVLLVEDHAVIREGLRALLKNEQDIAVVGEAEDGRQAVGFVRKNPPDVVLMDIALPVMNGMDATRQMRRISPKTAILVLSSYDDKECVEQLLNAGALGYLLKQTDSGELVRAIHEVSRGRRFLSPVITGQRERQTAWNRRFEGRSTDLTPRQIEVLEMVAQGLSNKQIAANLGISIKTIEKHRQQVMDKLNIHDTAGLTRYALSHKRQLACISG